jgi:hypothetical protein
LFSNFGATDKTASSEFLELRLLEVPYHSYQISRLSDGSTMEGLKNKRNQHFLTFLSQKQSKELQKKPFKSVKPRNRLEDNFYGSFKFKNFTSGFLTETSGFCTVTSG